MTFRQNPGIESATLQRELMLFDAATKRFCVLNSTAAQLWECMAEPKSESELTAVLRRKFNTHGAAVEQDLAAVMNELEALGLVIRE